VASAHFAHRFRRAGAPGGLAAYRAACLKEETAFEFAGLAVARAAAGAARRARACGL